MGTTLIVLECFEHFMLIIHAQLLLMKPSDMLLLMLYVFQKLHQISCSCFKQRFHPVRDEHVFIVSNDKITSFQFDPIGKNASAQIPPFSMLTFPSPMNLTLDESHKTKQERSTSEEVSIFIATISN